MFSAWIALILNSIFFSLRLSEGGGSFPRPLKAEEEREQLERFAQGDMEARNALIEHNLRLVAHIIKKGKSERRFFGKPVDKPISGLITGKWYTALLFRSELGAFENSADLL